MMQYQDLGLKLPSGLWAQPWRNHHHAFPYGGTLDLYEEPCDEGKDNRGPRQKNKEMLIFQHYCATISLDHFSRLDVLYQWSVIRKVEETSETTIVNM